MSDNPTVMEVIKDLLARDEVGQKKYGESLRPNNGRDNLQDLYEELLDAACYIKNAMRSEQEQKPLVDVYVLSYYNTGWAVCVFRTKEAAEAYLAKNNLSPERYVITQRVIHE